LYNVNQKNTNDPNAVMTQLQKLKQIIVSSDIPHPYPKLFPRKWDALSLTDDAH
jgi:hypothetical protein